MYISSYALEELGTRFYCTAFLSLTYTGILALYDDDVLYSDCDELDLFVRRNVKSALVSRL